MQDTFTLTLIFIILSTFIVAFLQKRSKNKCLKDFKNDFITLEKTNGEIKKGVLSVESTGIELIFREKQNCNIDFCETSYILYKYEYENIQAVIRFHDELTDEAKMDREKDIRKTYHPSALRRLKRKIVNIFKTLRDSVMEILNLLMSQAKKTTGAGAVLSSQDQSVNSMKDSLVGVVGTAYEPLLEKYIGKKVIIEFIKGDKVFKYIGILKEYTAEFIELLDIDYKIKEDQPSQKADLVMLRKNSIVRHAGE